MTGGTSRGARPGRSVRREAMKHTQQCPKCEGRRLWVVERFRLPGEAGPGAELPVVTHHEKGGLFTLGRASPVGRFNLWVCATCGFSELWAEGLEGLRDDPSAGIRLVDQSLDPAGPFR